MNINELKKQIEIYNQDNTLTDNIKNIRINIINTAVQRIEGYQLYSQTLYQYLNDSGELVQLTEELYQIEDTLELNRVSLKALILESSLCKMLDKNGIEYSLHDLKNYLYQNMNNPEIDVEVIGKEINLYETIERLVDYENGQIDNMMKLISNIIGVNIVPRFEDVSNITNNKNEVINKINNMFEINILDQFTHDLLVNMVNQVFDNYLKIEHKLNSN